MTHNELRAWKEKMGYNYTQAAWNLGVGRSTFSYMLSGTRPITESVAQACKDLDLKKNFKVS